MEKFSQNLPSGFMELAQPLPMHNLNRSQSPCPIGVDCPALIWDERKMSGIGSPNEQQQAMAQAIAAMQLPQLVLNSFANSFSPSEITSLLSFGPRPLLTLIMAPAVAKSFAMALLDTVQKYEAASGVTVLTMQELGDRLAAYQASQKP